MEITEGKEQVVISMSPAEWARFRNLYSAAWFFIKDEAGRSEPTGRTFGKNSESSEPFQDWAHRQIEKLADLVHENNGAIERRLASSKKIDDSHAMHLGRLEDLYGALKNKIEWIQESGAEAQAAIERRLSELENRLDTYGMPVAQGWASGVRVDENLPSGMMVMGEPDVEKIKQRLVTGEMAVLPDNPLEEAERRIRLYMENHFSEATIGGVVRALWGEEQAEQKIRDHRFQFTAPDRRHCSYQPEDDEKCGATRNRHLYHSARD